MPGCWFDSSRSTLFSLGLLRVQKASELRDSTTTHKIAAVSAYQGVRRGKSGLHQISRVGSSGSCVEPLSNSLRSRCEDEATLSRVGWSDPVISGRWHR